MQIGEPMLQLLLYKKAQSEQSKIIPEVNETAGLTEVNTANSSVLLTSEEYEIANNFAMSNTDTKSKVSIVNSSGVLTVNTQAVTISSLSTAEISRIKQIIYDLHHQTSSGGTGGTGGTEGSGSGEGSEETGSETTPSGKIGFMNDFSNVDELFDYINTIDSSVTKETGLDENALWQLTQRDDWEKNNNYFFGILNHGFNLVDTDNDGVLSYEEISQFIGEEMATANDYIDKVEQYSNQLQADFMNMTAQEKLDFAIEKAKEYFQQTGLTEQMQALNRLIAENKLGFMDLNPGKTYDPTVGGWYLGAYMSLTDSVTGEWVDDPLTYPGFPEYHGGIWLDEYYYCERSDALWYDLVGTLVHEVTHATAFLHTTDATAWGEYEAYQIEEDYLDSIACGKWDGSDEKTSITNHIDEYYNNETYTEPVPSGKWWTYGDYA